MYLFLHHSYKTLQGIILPILEVENQDAKNLRVSFLLLCKVKKTILTWLQTTQQNSRNPLFSAWGAPATVKDTFAESLILIVWSNFEWSLEGSNPSSWQCSKVPVLVTASKGTELLWFLTVSLSPWSSMLGSGMGFLRYLFSPKSHVQLNYSSFNHCLQKCPSAGPLHHPSAPYFTKEL